MVNGILYGVGMKNIYALDAAAGKVKWEYTMPPVQGRNPRDLLGRWQRAPPDCREG